MNVKELKKLLSELPEECDELPVFAFSKCAKPELICDITIVFAKPSEDNSTLLNWRADENEAEKLGFTKKAVLL